MRRRSLLSLATATLSLTAAGCSRDAPLAPLAPLAAPGDGSVAETRLAPAAVPNAERSVAPTDERDALDDAAQRLLPALGTVGTGLRAPLLRLQANPADAAAREALRRALDAAARTIADADRPDLDALRLQIAGGASQ